MNALVDFFSRDAGQARRNWLDSKVNALGEAVRYYAGPYAPNVNALAQMNPVQDVGNAMAAGRDGRWGDMAVDVATVVAPVAAGRAAKAINPRVADDAAQWLQDALTGLSVNPTRAGLGDAAQQFAADEYGGIKAFHGSPHDFDRFSMEKIGTGEGAQAYGHGLYFAESEDVARSYRDSLAQRVDVDGKPLLLNNKQVGTTGDDQIDDLIIAHNGDIEAAIADERAFADEMAAAGKTSRRYGGDPYTGVRKLEALRDKVQSTNSGHMYEININADPDDFLDWDKPLSEQTESVKRAFMSAQSGGDPLLAELMDTSPESMMIQGMVPNAKGSAAYRTYADDIARSGVGPGMRAEQLAAQELRDAGIPGIKYRDAGSRGMDGESGTRNLVVFDENLIEIVRKYGIAGAAAALGVSASDVQAAMGQEQ